MASLIDFILPEDEERYKEIIVKAAEAKALAPKVPRAKTVLTDAQIIKKEENKLAKLQAKLDALRAAQQEQ